MKVSPYIEIEIPTTPNFLRVKDSEESIPVWKLNDAEITSIGKQWTEALRDKAREQRLNHIKQ